MPSGRELTDRHLRPLADGSRIPLLGLGVYQIPDGPECVRAVRWALELGYRHIDTAQNYLNEESVGRAVKQSGIPREEIFVTTKFDPSGTDPAVEAERSLKRLGLDYVDLYLVHWPQGGALRAWPGMERTHERGYARSLGVSNYDVDELAAVLKSASVPPVVDQVQLSPFEFRRDLMIFGQKHSVALEAYSPLGTGFHVLDEKVKEVAERNGRTPAQVLLRWSIEKDLIVIPKSTHRERIEENARVFDFTLPPSDIAELDALDRTAGTASAQEDKWW